MYLKFEFFDINQSLVNYWSSYLLRLVSRSSGGAPSSLPPSYTWSPNVPQEDWPQTQQRWLAESCWSLQSSINPLTSCRVYLKSVILKIRAEILDVFFDSRKEKLKLWYFYGLGDIFIFLWLQVIYLAKTLDMSLFCGTLWIQAIINQSIKDATGELTDAGTCSVRLINHCVSLMTYWLI